MAQFDELQTLWQTQPSRAIPAFDPSALSGAFRRFGRRQDIINLAKCGLVVWAASLVFTAYHQRPLMAIGSAGLLLFAAIALIAEWRIQRGIARLNFTAPSTDFVRAAMEQLRAQRNPYHTPAYLSLFAAVFVGYNIMTFASWHRLTVERRILFHALASASPAIFYVLGRWVRAKRWNAEYRPLMERLAVLLETIEERAL